MKRFPALLACTLLLATAPALAHESGKMSMGHAGAGNTKMTGEVVDLGCYLGSAERGAKHASCATKCINQGMPMGLLTSGNTLYLLTMNHDNPDAYNQLKQMAAKTVTVTGTLMTRNGMRAIDVSGFRPAAAKS